MDQRVGPSQAALQIDLLARSGQTGAAARVLEEALRASGAGRTPYADAFLSRELARLGRADEAIVYLERAIADGESDVMLLGVDPAAGPLRADPRVERLLRGPRLRRAALELRASRGRSFSTAARAAAPPPSTLPGSAPPAPRHRRSSPPARR